MSSTYRPSGRVGRLFWLVGPALVAVSAAGGAAYAWGFEAIPIRWLIGLLPIFAAAGLGIAVDRGLTFAHVRSEGVGFLVGMACGLTFLVSGYLALYFISTTGSASGVGFFTYFGDRLSKGISLTSSVSIRGWLLGVLWVVEALCMLLAALGGGFAAATRVYCEMCESWANRDLWKFIVKGVRSDAISSIQSAETFQMALPRMHGDGDINVEYSVKGCRCASTAALAITSLKKTKDSVDRTALRESDVLTKGSLRELFDWAERIDPSIAARRPTITLRVQHRPLADDPKLVATLKPEGEHASHHRWAKWLGASDSYVDNDFTRAIRQRLREGDFLVAEEAVRMQRHPDDLAYVCEAIADWDQIEVPGMSEWLEERPDSFVPRLVQGIHLVKVAWHKRGMGWQPKNYAEFQRTLNLADAELERAAAMADGDPVSRTWLVYTAMGRQLPKAQAIARFEDAIKRYTSHRSAYSFMIQCAASKWGGTESMMMEVARRTCSLPPGKSAHVAIAEAHLEAAFSRARESKNMALIDEYLQQPTVRSELRAAHERGFRAGSFKPTMDTPRARQYFAYTLWRSGEKDAAAEHLRTFGKSSPWTVFSRPLFFWEGRDTIRRARRDCGVR
ncbi:MAG TPA: hypothetical protein VF777_09500 [Phycisphaerales bacterium]